MPAPIIGVTTNYVSPKSDSEKFGHFLIGESYIRAVFNAGGIPVAIPAGISSDRLSVLLSRLDGVLFTGGGDIDPERFNGVPHPRVYGIEPERDDLEIGLVQLAAATGKPFLGICRGIQVINVALGGTLFTDISGQLAGSLRHDHYPDIPRNHLAHAVSVTTGSALARVLDGDAFQVNSLHHQGIENVAPPLRAVAYAPDGLVEGVELTDHPFGLGVQWHPEWLQEHAPQRLLFQALVRAAANGQA